MDVTNYFESVMNSLPSSTPSELRVAIASQLIGSELERTNPIHICILVPSEDYIDQFKQSFENIDKSRFIRQGNMEYAEEKDDFNRIVQYLDYDKKLSVNMFTSLYSISDIDHPITGHLPNTPLVTLTTSKHGVIDEHETLSSQSPLPERILSQYDVVYAIKNGTSFSNNGSANSKVQFDDASISNSDFHIKENPEDIYEYSQSPFDSEGYSPSPESITEFYNQMLFVDNIVEFEDIDDISDINTELIAKLIFKGRGIFEDISLGEYDPEILESGISSQRDLEEELFEVLDEAKEGIPKTEIVYELSDEWYKDEIEEKLGELARDAEIMSTGGSGKNKRYRKF